MIRNSHLSIFGNILVILAMLFSTGFIDPARIHPTRFEEEPPASDPAPTPTAERTEELAPTSVPQVNLQPFLVFVEPAADISVVQGETITIQWTDEDTEENAIIGLAYDLDDQPENGEGSAWIAQNLPEDSDGEGDKFSFETTGVAPGSYTIWGMISDGVNPAVYAVAAGKLTITAVPVPTEEPAEIPTQEPTPTAELLPTSVPTEEPTPIAEPLPTSVPTEEPTPTGEASPTAVPAPPKPSKAMPLINDTRTLPRTVQQRISSYNKSHQSAEPPSFAPGYYDTSVFMTGTVAVGIVLPESSGSGENWDTARQDTVISQIQTGMNWWTSKGGSAANLNFVYDIRRSVPTSYEPIQMNSSDDNIWIGDVLTNMGFSGSDNFEQTYAYLDYLRTENNTKWAFVIFVADSLNDDDGTFFESPYFAYAYLGGPLVVMTYDNDGWGIENMNYVAAHETGHIFMAADEYYAPGYGGCTDTTTRFGYLGIENGNCENGNPASVDCNMKNNSDTLCDYSKAQIGWKDSNSNGIYDPIDTYPAFTFHPYSPDPAPDSILTYSGYAYDNPWPHAVCGSWDACFYRDLTINTISTAELSMDGGLWTSIPAGDSSYNSEMELITFDTPTLTEGEHTIDVRAFNTTTRSTTWSDQVTYDPLASWNDDFDSPNVISSMPSTDIQSIGAATVASDDPGFSCSADHQRYNTVWYQFTPSSSGMLDIDTFGSDYDTVLGVWSGSRGALQNQACNDDYNEQTQSKVSLFVTTGIPYFIEVASYSQATSGNLNISFSIRSCPSGLCVLVNDSNGFPASNADVSVYPDLNTGASAWNVTDLSGQANLAVNPGNYILVVSSNESHFIVTKNVTAPGYVLVDPDGTVQVNLSVKKTDGSAMSYAFITANPSYNATGWLGNTDSNGTLAVWVTPHTYSFSAISWDIDPYYLTKNGVVVSGTTSVNLHAASMPKGYLQPSLSGFNFGFVCLWGEYSSSAPCFEFSSRARRVTLSAMNYGVQLEMDKYQGENIWWYTTFKEFTITNGGTANYPAGGNFTISTNANAGTHFAGESVTITNSIRDEYNNQIYSEGEYIPGSPPTAKGLFIQKSSTNKEKPVLVQSDKQSSSSWTSFNPYIAIQDPASTVISEARNWNTWYSHEFNLPFPSVIGTHTVDLTLDTGPHMGVISDQSTFQVEDACATQLCVQVNDEYGNPLADAYLRIYSSLFEWWFAEGWTNNDGIKVFSNVPAGNYTMVTSSNSANLVKVQSITSPGLVTVDPGGTYPVTIEARQKDGSPLVDATIVAAPSRLSSEQIGLTDASGILTIHASPGTYAFSATGYTVTNPYYLIKGNVEISGISNIELFAASMPTGELLVDLKGFDWTGVCLGNQFSRINTCAYLENGARIVLSAMDYEQSSNLGISLDGWNSYFATDSQNITVPNGGLYTLTAGGDFSIATNASQEGYTPGDLVHIDNLIKDSYGHQISWAWRDNYGASLPRPSRYFDTYQGKLIFLNATPERADFESFEIFPRITVMNPAGTIISQAQNGENWRTHEFNLPVLRSAGTHTINLTMETGPHMGIISDQDTFNIPPAPPVLNLPVANAIVIGTPTFSWLAATGANAYLFAYDNNADFSSPTYTSGTLSVMTYKPPAIAAGTYYWHVKSRDAAFNWGPWSAGRKVVINLPVPTAPSPITPSGISQDRTPTYKWSKAIGATKYQFEVIKGTTTVMVNQVVNTPICTTTYCTYTPTTSLVDYSYKWRVRAYKSGVWSAYSSYASFDIANAFSSSFNGSMSGWASKPGGTWGTTSATMYTNGITNKWSSAYRAYTIYNKFIFTARIKREYDSYSANFLNVRMGSTTSTNNFEWYPGYNFGYSNDGYYSIWEVSSTGLATDKQPWTYTPAIVKYGWNTLKVTGSGSTFTFSINGVVVKTFTDSSFSQGYVGFQMYKNITAGKFLVDWATLTIPAISSLGVDRVGSEQAAFNRAAMESGEVGSQEGHIVR
jgi:hypothetical protein